MRLLFFLILAAPFATTAQALRDINYSYLYNNSNPITVRFQTVRNSSDWTTSFQLVSTDTTQQISDYEVRFETRASLGEKEGSIISPDSSTLTSTSAGISARVITPLQPQPIILAADRQTIGGYPVIACVISADRPLLAQLRPGSKVRFAEVSHAEAESLIAHCEHNLATLKRAIQQLT